MQVSLDVEEMYSADMDKARAKGELLQTMLMSTVSVWAHMINLKDDEILFDVRIEGESVR
jgi:hypothetical protein